MNCRLTFICLAAMVIAACGKPDVPVESGPAPDVAPAKPVVVAEQRPLGDAILVGGYVPAFAHKVRSQRVEGGNHFVVLEYFGVDRDAAISALSDSLRNEGFKVAGPQPRDAAVQYVYIKPDGQRMSAIFSDPSSKKLMNHEARGIAMFSWTDTPAQ